MDCFLKFMLFSLCSFAYQETAYVAASGLLGKVSNTMGFVGNAVQIGQSMYEGADKLYQMLQPTTTKESESDQKIEPGMEQRITDQIKHVSTKLDSLKVNIQNMKDEIIDKIVNEIPEQVSLKSNLQEIYDQINKVENLFENFFKYITAPSEFSRDTIQDFANHATSHDLNELPNVLKTIHWRLIQTDYNANAVESVLTILSRNNQVPHQMCKRRQSLQQLLYSLYNIIVLADVKGFTMIQTSYSILESLTGVTREGEKKLAKEQFTNRITNTVKAVKKAMASTSRAVWACDAYSHQKDVTYTELQNLFQKYIVNEADISGADTCTDTCADFKVAFVQRCYDPEICNNQRTCTGALFNCEYKTASDMYICPSDPNSSRRYEYVEYGNSQRYGPPGTCSTSSVTASSWHRGTVMCNYCICTCDDFDNINSDRYVNLRKVYSDRYGNYVVTGVRFRKDNHILHIQIQQGTLLPGGEINATTVHWKPINSYKVDELPKSKYENKPQENKDYYRLVYADRYNRRAAVNLDDIDFGRHQLGGDYVVTGLQFKISKVYGSGYHVNVMIHVSPFDFKTGVVRYHDTEQYSPIRDEPIVYKSNKTEVILDNYDVPTRSGSPAVPTSQPNEFLYFTTTSLDKDAGQSTIPFIDLQSVETNPPAPLSGIGLFHKSSPGSGGFLSLKAFTYNYAPHLNEEVN